jgi:hypothetical protein
MRVAQATYNESIRNRTRMDFFNWGVTPDYEAIAAQARAEAFPCPICFKMIHPDLQEKHNSVYHPVKPVLPTEPVICTHTKFSVGQVVRIAGTSHTLPVKEVKTFSAGSTVWYRFDIEAGDVKHQWFAEERLTGAETILPVPVKSSEPVKVAEYRKPHLMGQTTLFPYGAYKFVA